MMLIVLAAVFALAPVGAPSVCLAAEGDDGCCAHGSHEVGADEHRAGDVHSDEHLHERHTDAAGETPCSPEDDHDGCSDQCPDCHGGIGLALPGDALLWSVMRSPHSRSRIEGPPTRRADARPGDVFRPPR